MLKPDIAPQLTFQLFSNSDYQLLEKDINPKMSGKKGNESEDEAVNDGDGTDTKKFVMKYNENIEAINQDIELDQFIIQTNLKTYKKRNFKQMKKNQ